MSNDLATPHQHVFETAMLLMVKHYVENEKTGSQLILSNVWKITVVAQE